MGRYDAYGQRDTQDFVDSDAFWNGIDMTRDRAVLPPGTLAVGRNGRCRDARYRQRAGTIYPPDFNPAFSNAFAGSGIFQDPNGNEQLLIAPVNAQYTLSLRDGKDAVQIAYSATEIGSGRTNGSIVEFAQSFDKVQLLRTPFQSGQKNLVWDGDNGTKWEIIALSAEGLSLVGHYFNAEPFADRLIYYNANYPIVPHRDTWIISDVEDYTSYDPVYQTIRTNPGESDFITRIMRYFRSSVIVFKNHSIHQATPVPGVYPFVVQQRSVSLLLGSIGNKIPLEVGGDIIFLSYQTGFYRLSQIDQENIATLPVPISEPIQQVIDDINWDITALSGCSAVLDNYALFGVALGGDATRCNAILVYNTQSGKWESVPDTWADPEFGFNALHVTNFDGSRRVFAVDYLNSVVYLLYEGVGDEMKSGVWSVPFKMETRGYTGNDPINFKRFLRGTVAVSTSNPAIKITAINDGVNEEKLLTPVPITKDREQYYTFGKADFNPDTDDPTQPWRKDYSLPNVDLVAIEDFEELPDGEIKRLPPTSIPVVNQKEKQESTERRLIRTTGRWVSLRVENDSGVCDVLSTSVEGTKTMSTIRTVA